MIISRNDHLKWSFPENVLNLRPSKIRVCFFMGTDLEKCSITSLAHQWILCREWVPSEWESKQLIKNITIIHTTPVYQLMSCKVKSWVCNKQILWSKYKSIIHNNAFSSENIHLLLSSHIKIHWNTSLELFCSVLSLKQCLILILISWFRPERIFFHWKKQYYGLRTRILAGSSSLKLKTS